MKNNADRSEFILKGIHRFSEYETHTFPNGVRLYMQRDENPMPAISIGIGVGSCHFENSTLAHYGEHHLDILARKKATRATRNELERRIYGITNASTYAEFMFLGMGDSKDYHRIRNDETGDYFDIMDEYLSHREFDPGLLRTERRAISHEIMGHTGMPLGRFEENVNMALWSGHRYGRGDAGTIGDAERIGPEDLIHFMEHCGGRNLHICVIGDIDPDYIVGQIGKTLGSARNGGYRIVEEIPCPQRLGKHEFFEGDFENLDSNSVEMNFRLYGNGSKVPANVLACYLTEGGNSVLFREIREEKGLCYSVGSESERHSRGGSLTIRVSKLERKDAEKVVGIIGNELEKIRQGNVDPERLETSKLLMLGNFYLDHLEPVGERAETINVREMLGIPNQIGAFADNVMSVKKEDLQEAAGMLREDCCVTAFKFRP